MSREDLKSRLIALLQKVGYPTDAVNFICQKLDEIANRYNNAQAAFEIIVQVMERKITGPFSSQQFTAFIREIDPTHTPLYIYYHELGIAPDEVDMLDLDEQAEYWQDKQELDRRLSSLRCDNHDYLQDSGAWDILTSHSWRVLKPSMGIYKEIQGGTILTPMGGQPGYKRRTRHP